MTAANQIHAIDAMQASDNSAITSSLLTPLRASLSVSLLDRRRGDLRMVLFYVFIQGCNLIPPLRLDLSANHQQRR